MFNFCSTSVSGFIQCYYNLYRKHWVAFYQHDWPVFDFSASSVHWDDIIVFFFFFRTVLLLIRIILEYCQCVDNIPSITTDMLTRLSDLLKVWLQMVSSAKQGQAGCREHVLLSVILVFLWVHINHKNYLVSLCLLMWYKETFQAKGIKDAICCGN